MTGKGKNKTCIASSCHESRTTDRVCVRVCVCVARMGALCVLQTGRAGSHHQSAQQQHPLATKLDRRFSPNHAHAPTASSPRPQPRPPGVATAKPTAAPTRRLSAPLTGAAGTNGAFATAKSGVDASRRPRTSLPPQAGGGPINTGAAPRTAGRSASTGAVPTFTFDEVTPGMQEITAWLADIGFVEYADGILNQGWDDLDLLRVELMSGDADRVLLDAGVIKGGHRAKIRYVAAMDSKARGLTMDGSGKGPSATALMYLSDRGANTPRSTLLGTPRASGGAAVRGAARSLSGTRGRTRARTLSPEWPRAGSATARRAGSRRLLRDQSFLSSSSRGDDDDDSEDDFFTGRPRGRAPTTRKKRKGVRKAKTPLSSGRVTNAKIRALAADEKRLRKFMTQYIYSPHLV